MIAAFDTYYMAEDAKTVCMVFESWNVSAPHAIYTETRKNTEPYVPGSFYKRELPCIVSLFQKVKTSIIDAIVIDGFVYLDDQGRFGLGGHLYKQLGEAIPVIGVAKTDFKGVENKRRKVFRGISKRPLYVTAIGMDVEQAATNIQQMAGTFRIPTLLKELDQLTKQP